MACEVSDEVAAELEDIKAKTDGHISAIILKINKDVDYNGADDPNEQSDPNIPCEIIIEKRFDESTIGDIDLALPGSKVRYLVINYGQYNTDGNASHHFCLVYSKPEGCHRSRKEMYDACLDRLTETLNLQAQPFVLTTGEITEEWLQQQLQ